MSARLSTCSLSLKAMKSSASENDFGGATAPDSVPPRTPSERMPASAFIKKALPLHVNLTHTPPNLPDEDEVVVPNDVGHIGTLTLIPCTFPTGACGWKGTRTVKVELLDVEEGEEPKQVEVVLSVDGIVIGCKEEKGQRGEPASEADGGTEGYESDNDTDANASSKNL